MLVPERARGDELVLENVDDLPVLTVEEPDPAVAADHPERSELVVVVRGPALRRPAVGVVEFEGRDAPGDRLRDLGDGPIRANAAVGTEVADGHPGRGFEERVEERGHWLADIAPDERHDRSDTARRRAPVAELRSSALTACWAQPVLVWKWASIPPGITIFPAASRRHRAPRGLPGRHSPATRPSRIPTSAVRRMPSVTTVPPRIEGPASPLELPRASTAAGSGTAVRT